LKGCHSGTVCEVGKEPGILQEEFENPSSLNPSFWSASTLGEKTKVCFPFF